MRRQRWLNRLLEIIGTGLERTGRALKGQNGEPTSTIPPADPDSPPAHWLELLSKSQVPLVWMRQEADDANLPADQVGWQLGVPFQSEQPANDEEAAPSGIPMAINHASSLEPPLPAIFPEAPQPEIAKDLEWLQKTQEIHKTRQPGRSVQEDKTPEPRTGMSIIPQTSIPAKPQSAPRYATRNAFRLIPTARVGQLDHGQRAKQTESNTPRYVHARPQPQGELHWPERSSGTSAIVPRYETSQRSVAKEVSYLEVSKESKAHKNLYPNDSLSVDRWPSLPADWLATEPETSPTQLERSHRQRLEQEWRGE